MPDANGIWTPRQRPHHFLKRFSFKPKTVVYRPSPPPSPRKVTATSLDEDGSQDLLQQAAEWANEADRLEQGLTGPQSVEEEQVRDSKETMERARAKLDEAEGKAADAKQAQ